MFHITPKSALRSVSRMTGDKLVTKWEPCRVVGAIMKDGEPAYVVEVFEGGESYLTTEDSLRYPAPTA